MIKKAKTQKTGTAVLEKTYAESNSLRSVGRLFDISYLFFFNTLKKKHVSCKDTDILEVDEICSCINSKINQIRHLDSAAPPNKANIIFFIGDGTMDSCKKLWHKLSIE